MLAVVVDVVLDVLVLAVEDVLAVVNKRVREPVIAVMVVLVVLVVQELVIIHAEAVMVVLVAQVVLVRVRVNVLVAPVAQRYVQTTVN